MLKYTFLILFLLNFSSFIYSQNLLLEKEWDINHIQGSCTVDTFIYSIWLFIDPNQQITKYENNEDFVVIEVTATNNSSIDIYLKGSDNILYATLLKVNYVPNYDAFKQHYFIKTRIDSIGFQHFDTINMQYGTMPMKFENVLGFIDNDRNNDPHKFIKMYLNNDIVQIPKGSRKKFLCTIPKRKGNYFLQTIIGYNTKMNGYDCFGNEVGWTETRTINSNKIELIRIKK